MDGFIVKKSLGQHWLTDEAALKQISGSIALDKNDTVLEIGPGLGALTKYLVEAAGQVIAVELDINLASGLKGRVIADNLKVINQDILKFDLNSLPPDYKVAANIPYYLTSKLLRVLSESPNSPKEMVLLVQKEVAQRIAAKTGNMSILAVSVQLYNEADLGQIVPAAAFSPRPKVDSQVVILRRRAKPLFDNLNSQYFFQLVKAGFSAKRKKLRSSLAGGLRLPKGDIDRLLADADINGDLRAEALSLNQWHQLYTQFIVIKDLKSLLSH